MITGEKIYLKLLSEDDVTPEYLNWMHNNEVIKYLESRWQVFTIDKLKKYVNQINDGYNNFLYGIYSKKTNDYIGNIKIGNINNVHRKAEVGIIIGNKNYWSQGIATEAINLIKAYSFNDLNLHKLTAGMYLPNIGSYKAFIKAGFAEVGIYKEHCFFDGHYVDCYILEVLNNMDNKK